VDFSYANTNNTKKENNGTRFDTPSFGVDGKPDSKPDSARRYRSLDRANSAADLETKNNKVKNNKYFQTVKEEDEDFEPQRLSRISKRNVEIEQKLYNKDEEEPGLFEKILMGLGCISRDPAKFK